MAIPGVAAVYFQPPTNIQMKYPCIRYSPASDRPIRANNNLYGVRTRYTATVIDKAPDSKIVEEMRKLPYCAFDRAYIADNLNHFVFTIY